MGGLAIPLAIMGAGVTTSMAVSQGKQAVQAAAQTKKPATPPPTKKEPETILEPRTMELVKEEAREVETRRARRRRGRPETIITGELEPTTTKKTLLG